VEYAILIASVVVVPIAIGWLYGRNDVDPYTTSGKAYYNTNKGE